MEKIPYELSREQAEKVWEWYNIYLNMQDVLSVLDEAYYKDLVFSDEEIWKIAEVYTRRLQENEYGKHEVLESLNDYINNPNV